MQKAKETAGELVEAREDVTKMLDLVEKTLDQSPFAVAPSIIVTRYLPILARRDDRDRAVVNDKGNEIITIKGTVCQNVIPDLFAQQRFGLCTLVTFATRQDKVQGITQPIDFGMDFGAKPAPTPSQGLRVLPTVFLTPPLHTDGHARYSHPPSHFPGRGHRQNRPSFVPTRRDHTSAQNVCRCCSSSHTQLATSATAPHCATSITHLLQSDGTRPPARYRSANTSGEIRGSLSIVRPLRSLVS